MREISKTQIRLDAADYKMLKKLAYLKETSINSLMQVAIKEYIEKDRKVLLNAQIVVT